MIKLDSPAQKQEKTILRPCDEVLSNDKIRKVTNLIIVTVQVVLYLPKKHRKGFSLVITMLCFY